MTDLATTLTTLAATLDRVDVTHADVINTSMSGDVVTLHLRDSGVSRLVAAHGNMDSHSVIEYAPEGVLISHHHTVDLNGTDGRVRLLWVVRAEVVAQAA